MKAIESISRTFCAANIYFDVSHIDVHTSGTVMGTGNTSAPTTIDFNSGVLHVHVQVALATLNANDAAAPRPLFVRGNFAVDGNVANNEIVVAAELLLCIVTVTTIAMDSMR